MSRSRARRHGRLAVSIATVALALALVAAGGTGVTAAPGADERASLLQDGGNISFAGPPPDVEAGDVVELELQAEDDYPGSGDSFGLALWERGPADGYALNATVPAEARTVFFDTAAAGQTDGNDTDVIWAEDADGNEVEVTVESERALEDGFPADVQINADVGEDVQQARQDPDAVSFFNVVEEGDADDGADGMDADGTDESDGDGTDDTEEGDENADGDDGDDGDGLHGFGVAAALAALLGAVALATLERSS